jgi:tetratricopeptide (TPR) repeat protein
MTREHVKEQVRNSGKSQDLDKSSETYRAGREAMERADYARAIALFEQSIAASPHFKALELLGECLLKTQEPLAAVVPLAASAGLSTNGFRATYLLAEAYLELGDRDKALGYVDRALQMKPDFKRASQLKGQLRK